MTLERPNSPSPWNLGWKLLFALLITALCAASYWSSLRNPLLMDDAVLLEMNSDVSRPAGLKELWLHDYWNGSSPDRNLYRPITILTFHVNHRLARSPEHFRAWNVLLLAACGWMLAHLLARRRVPLPVALIVALLFVAHPTSNAVVNQVVGRSDLLALLAILIFLALQARALASSRWSVVTALSALLAAIAAVGSKETGVLLAPAALVQAWVGGGHVSPRLWRVTGITGTIVVVALALFAVGRAIAIGSGVDYAPLHVGARSNPLQWIDWSERLPAALSIAALYARQLVWPDLSFYHHPDVLPGWGDLQVWAGAGLLLSTLIGLALLVRSRSWLAPFVVLALGSYLVVGNLLFPVGVYAANRLMLPITLAAAASLAWAWSSWVPDRRATRAATLIVGGALILPMFSKTHEINRAWRSASTALRFDVDRHPERVSAAVIYGEALVFELQFAEGARWLETALERDPHNPLARTVLAVADRYLALIRQ